MAYQAAYYSLYGRIESQYEPAMTKGFRSGRTEAIRSVTPECVFSALLLFVSSTLRLTFSLRRNRLLLRPSFPATSPPSLFPSRFPFLPCSLHPPDPSPSSKPGTPLPPPLARRSPPSEKPAKPTPSSLNNALKDLDKTASFTRCTASLSSGRGSGRFRREAW